MCRRIHYRRCSLTCTRTRTPVSSALLGAINKVTDGYCASTFVPVQPRTRWV